MKKIILSLFCLVTFINIKAQINITIGGQIIPNSSTESSPINIYYKSHHCQILYTASELNGAGWTGTGTISKLGFNIFGTTTEGLPNFSIKLKNTTSTNVAVYDNSALTIVYTSALYLPSAGGFELLNMGNTFLWDGISNILVDVCFDQVANYTQSGQVYMYNYVSSGSEYQFIRGDIGTQCDSITNQSNLSFKPQIRFEITSTTACSGIPNSGIATTSNSLVCSNTAFNLNLLNGSNEAGISFQWQSSSDTITWSNLGSAQSDWSYSVNGISDTTYYRCVSTCTNLTLSDTSTSIVVNFNPLINCYCIPSYSLNCNGDKFLDFSLANVVNQSNNCDASGFSDLTSISLADVNVNAGLTYTLSVNTSSTGIAGNASVGAWIDYNQNAIFENSEFTYLGFGSALSYSKTLTIPINAQTGSVRMRLKLDAINATAATTLDPCNNNNSSIYGQILDYKVNITAAPACSLTPNAGNAVSTLTNVCLNTPYTLDLAGNDIVNGINYQWQTSLNGSSWSNIGSVQNITSFAVPSQSVTTYYQCVLTCTNSAISATSTPVMVNQNLPTACYCVPQPVNCSSSQITNVKFETINDNPTCVANGYTDNTSAISTISLTANQTYTFSSTLNIQSGTGYLGCWIDHDQNGIFDANEYSDLGNTSISNTITTNINIPFTATGGNTRMRLKMESSWSTLNSLDPCTGNMSDGQTLDYLINITPAQPCSGIINPGTTIAPASVCSGNSFTLNLANNDIVSGATYQWFSSSNGTTYTALGGLQTTVNYIVSSQTTTTYYMCDITCPASGSSNSSINAMVTQNPLTACYCIPPVAICSNGDEINNVLFAALSNTSACSVGGYENYSTSVPSTSLNAGQSYTIAVTVGSDNFGKVSAWIDYDQNGIFDANEYTDLGVTNSTGIYTIVDTINIPVNALLGNTKIRIRNNNQFTLGPDYACTSGAMAGKSMFAGPSPGNGETEDYLLTIMPPDCGSIIVPPTIPITGPTKLCLGQSTTLDFSSSIPSATGLTYQWKSSTGGLYSNLGPNSATFAISPTINTSYYCEVYCNGTAIRNTDTLLVKINSLTISPVITNSVCNGTCNGSIILNAVSSSSIIYTWQPTNISTSDIAIGLCAGSYTAIVTDVQGSCSITNTFVITQPGAFSVSIAGKNSICEQLEDTITSSIIGGVSPFIYSWTQLPGTVVSNDSNYTYTSTIGTYSYNLNVTDATNCAINSNTISITVNPSSNFSGIVTTNTTIPVAGLVTLYKYLPYYTKFDSVTSQNIGATGDFLFNSFTAGTYIIKAIPTANNLQITYGDSAVNWKTAKHIIHGCAVNDIQNINVKALSTFTTTGTGSLSGKITEGDKFGQRIGFGFKPMAPGEPIGGIVVKGGRNPGGQMFVQTITDSTGYYSLPNLPINTGNESYFILVDIPGLDTNNTYHQVITLTNNAFINLDFVVDSAKINPIHILDVSVNDISAIENQIKVYPNPATNKVTIQYNLLENSNVKIELYDILGKSVKTILPLTQQNNREHSYTIQLNDLTSGMYFMKLKINNSESVIKLVINN